MRFSKILFSDSELLREKKLCYGYYKGYFMVARKVEYDVYAVMQFGD